MSIYTKLLEIQKLHLEFEKDTTNPFFKSKYVSLDSIVSKLTPHLDKLGILVLHRTENNEVITEIIDTEETSYPIISRFPLVQSPDPQKLGSCITYAKRYNLGQLFNIVTDRDDDGNEASEVETKKENTPKPYAKQQDEFGLDLDDYIASIAMEKDSESLKLLYVRGLKLCISEKQKDWFTSLKDKQKKVLGL